MKSQNVKFKLVGKSFLTMVLLALFVTCFAPFAYSQDESISVATAEDENRITIRHNLPEFVPLKVEFFNLNSEDVLRDFEVKITNTSEKPIYSLRFDFQIGDYKEANYIPIVLQEFEYGRHDLSGGANESEKNNIRPTDVPINPNESVTFKLREIVVKVHRKNIETGFRQKSKTYELDFDDLTYGDRSGYTKGGFFEIKKKL